MTGKTADKMNKQEERKDEGRHGWTGGGERQKKMLTKKQEPECILIKTLRNGAMPLSY